MVRFAPLVIHRSEWNRLKTQANPIIEPKKVPRNVDIEAMNQQSRKWTSNWPDTVQGHVKKVVMKKKQMHLDEIAAIDAFHKKKKHENTAETLKRARDMIFERSGYGKMLLSALFESKTLDERELQIKFKKEIQEKEKQVENAKPEVQNIMYSEFEKGDRNRILRKQIDRDNAEYNKVTREMKEQEALRTAEIEKKNREEDAIMIEKLHKLQILEEKQDYCLDKEAVKIYEQQNKTIQEMREKREILDQKLADLWKKHQDRVRLKEKQVFDQIHKEKRNTQRFKENYELVQRIQNNEEEKYKDFIDKGVKKLEKRLQKREIEEKHKTEQERKIKALQAERLKSEHQTDRKNCQKKLCSDKQSFLPTRRGKVNSKQLKEASHPPRVPLFLAPPNTLQQALQQRRASPPHWSGAAGAHEQFARNAGAALAEATHKRLVRKVIDRYRKENNVNDLQVPNY